MIPPLPTTLKIAAFDMRVVEMSLDDIETDERLQGRVYYQQNKIKIKIHGQNKWDVMDSLLHEIGHAICWAYHIDPEDGEERNVGTNATAWTQIYRDNPELVDWIRVVITPEPEF